MGTKTTPPLTFRCSKLDRMAFKKASKLVGLTVGEWLRMVARQAAGL